MAAEYGISIEALMSVATIGGLSIVARVVERLFQVKAVAPVVYVIPLAHSTMQILWNVAEITIAIILMTMPSFLDDYWNYLFIGFFLHDGVEIVCRWSSFSPAFRTFVLKHHIMSLAISLRWMCFRIFTSVKLGPKVYTIIMLWDASSGLSDAMFWYDCLRKGKELRKPNYVRLPSKQLAARRYRIYVAACIAQRVWRIATYVAGSILVLTSDISDFALLIVLGPGLMMDAFDCKGQYGTFLTLRKALRGELAPATSKERRTQRRKCGGTKVKACRA